MYPPEIYLVRIGYPCVKEKYERKQVSEDDFSRVRHSIYANEPLDRDHLKKLFPNATKHLKEWTSEEILDYFFNKHKVASICLVQRVQLIDKLKGLFKADLGNGSSRWVDPEICPQVSVGDYVVIHRGSIVLE